MEINHLATPVQRTDVCTARTQTVLWQDVELVCKVIARVTRRVCEKNAQNVAQPIFVKINVYLTSAAEKKYPKN
jgi:hypothetical protein